MYKYVNYSYRYVPVVDARAMLSAKRAPFLASHGMEYAVEVASTQGAARQLAACFASMKVATPCRSARTGESV